MSSAYFTKKLKIPDGFDLILKDFTREILREQPANIYEFGAAYFEQKSEDANKTVVDEYDGAEEEEEELMTAAELEAYLTQLFLESDSDNNGYLDYREFKDIMQAAEMGLSDDEIYILMEEADENMDGKIEYKEFIPLAVETIQTVKSKAEAEQREAEMMADAEAAAEMYLLRGISREELDLIIQEEFQRADLDGNGVLSRKEFRKALKAEKLGLSRKEINSLMARIDENGDGNIQYEEFAPLCFELLLQRFKRSLYEQQRNSDELKIYLEELFRAYDEDGSGRLPVEIVQEALRGSEVGLSPIKIYSMLADAIIDEEGMIEYSEFSATAAGLLKGFLKPVTKEEAEAMSKAANSDAMELLGMTAEDLEASLRKAFEAQDAEGTGIVATKDLATIISGAGLNLTDRQIQALATTSTSPETDYEGLVSISYELLVLIAREQLVNDELASLQIE